MNCKPALYNQALKSYKDKDQELIKMRKLRNEILNWIKLNEFRPTFTCVFDRIKDKLYHT